MTINYIPYMLYPDTDDVAANKGWKAAWEQFNDPKHKFPDCPYPPGSNNEDTWRWQFDLFSLVVSKGKFVPGPIADERSLEIIREWRSGLLDG